MQISNTKKHTYSTHFSAAYKHRCGIEVESAQNRETIKEQKPVCFAPSNDKEIFDYLRAHYLTSIGIYEDDFEETLKSAEKIKNKNAMANLSSIANFTKTSDNIGYRGSSVFSSRGKKNIRGLKKLGIKRIIDLRFDGPYEYCKDICTKANLEYLKYPIKWGEKWEESDIEGIIDLIKELRKGNYYIGCAMGSHRTDAALSIAYCLDANAKNPPKLISGTTTAKMRTIMCKVFGTINEICYADGKGNPRLNKDFLKQLGWKDTAEFLEALPKRKKAIKNFNDMILKSGKLC